MVTNELASAPPIFFKHAKVQRGSLRTVEVSDRFQLERSLLQRLKEDKRGE